MKVIYDQDIPIVAQLLPDVVELLPLPATDITSHRLQDADALLVRSVTTVNKSLLNDSNIQFVATASAGYDHIDTSYLDKESIAWAAAPGCNAIAVAEYVLFVIAALQQQQQLPVQPSIALVGVGATGSRVATLCERLGMKVFCYDPPRAMRDTNFCSIQYNDIFSADIISLHVPLIEGGEHSTWHFVDEVFVANCKPGTLLVNASRGDVLDPVVLSNDKLIYAIDTWHHEPDVSGKALQAATIATPHIAGHTIEAKQRASQMVCRAVCQHFGFNADKIVMSSAQEKISYAAESTWQKRLLSLFDPIAITKQFQQFSKASHDRANVFTSLRKQYGLRHELAIIKQLQDQLPFALLQE